MDTTNSRKTKSTRKPNLGRTLEALLKGASVTSAVKCELTGSSAEAWRELEGLAKPLGLNPEDVLTLLLEAAFHRVRKVLESQPTIT